MTLVLVHGAGSGPWIFDEWLDEHVVAVDLHEGLDVATASMDDYARVLRDAADRVPSPLTLCGWSMGGLVAMMAAPAVDAAALVVIEPSPPAELQGQRDVAEVVGTFDAEEVYGTFPQGVRACRESLRARADRKRGISVPALPARSLVIYGDEFEHERGRALAELYGVEGAHFAGLDHWGLVLSPAVRRVVLDYANERRPPRGRPPLA